jgi:hypothetical protein
MSIVPVDYMPRLSTINCSRPQTTLLTKIKMISARVEDVNIANGREKNSKKRRNI